MAPTGMRGPNGEDYYLDAALVAMRELAAEPDGAG